MITTELKQTIVKELSKRRVNFTGSDAKFAVSLGINTAQYSRVKNGEIERVLSEANWISLARILELSVTDKIEWQIANTPVYQFITRQLKFCQDNATSRMMCDNADIGKTIAAKAYVRSNTNAIYIDCSQVKNKQKFVRAIAKEFGVGHTGKYNEVYADLVFYLRSLPAPLIILDEFGDLEYTCFLEIKALWNATENACGWYAIGADGLKAKIERGKNNKKVGFVEFFSRFGNRYQKITPDGKEERTEFEMTQAALIIKANAPEADIKSIIKSSHGSLRRIACEIKKTRRAA
jgi:DNA transposition AAA+ family ATPase